MYKGHPCRSGLCPPEKKELFVLCVCVAAIGPEDGTRPGNVRVGLSNGFDDEGWPRQTQCEFIIFKEAEALGVDTECSAT